MTATSDYLNEPARDKRDVALDLALAALRALAWSNSNDGALKAIAWKALHRCEALRGEVR